MKCIRRNRVGDRTNSHVISKLIRNKITGRASCRLQHDAVFGGPLRKGPMDVRVSLEDSLPALVGN